MRAKTYFLLFFLLCFVFSCSKKKEEVLPQYKLEKILEIGVMEGDENHMFAGIIDAEVDSRCNIYVLDWKYKTVKKFDENGTFLANIGTEGQGPGEFSSILVDCCLGPDDKLYVMELTKVHVFSAEGNHIKTFNPGFYSASRILVNQQGQIILAGNRENKNFHIFDQEGEFIESFGDCIPAPSPDYKKYQETWRLSGVTLAKDGRLFGFNPFKYEILIFADKAYQKSLSREVPGFTPPEVTRTGESSYSWSNIPCALLTTDFELLAFYGPKELQEKGMGCLDIYSLDDHRFLGSLEIEGLPSTVDNQNNIYCIEFLDVPKVIKFKFGQSGEEK